MKLLFERLLEPGESQFDVREAIVANLRRLVSTRLAITRGEFYSDSPQQLGGRSAQLDVLTCGVTSVVDLGSGDLPAIQDFGARLQALIDHYEPRIRRASVELVPARSGAPLRLVIHGEFDSSEGPQILRFPVDQRMEDKHPC